MENKMRFVIENVSAEWFDESEEDIEKYGRAHDASPVVHSNVRTKVRRAEDFDETDAAEASKAEFAEAFAEDNLTEEDN